MKICHVSSVHESLDGRLQKECSSLAKRDEYEVFLVAKGDSYTRNGVKVVGIGNAPSGRLKRMFAFSKKVVRKALELDADVYHLHDPELLQYVSMFKKYGKLVVFDQHEDVADSILDKEYIPTWLRKTVAKTYGLYSNSKLKICDAVVSVTPHIIDKLLKIQRNVYMVTNYPEWKEVTINLDRKIEYHTVLFAGGVAPQWSHDTVLKAIEAVDNMTYELYGPMEEGYLQTLSVLPGWQKTHYHGKVPFREVQEALYSGGIAVALLQPSNNTGGMRGTIGNTKLFEGMQAGLPLICTDFEMWREIIEKGHCGICISPSDEKALIKALTYLRDHPAEARQMGENGRALVKSKYNWGTQEKVLYRMYAELEERRLNETR